MISAFCFWLLRQQFPGYICMARGTRSASRSRAWPMISSCLFSLEGPSAYLTLEGQFQSSSLCSQKNTAEVTFVMPFFRNGNAMIKTWKDRGCCFGFRAWIKYLCIDRLCDHVIKSNWNHFCNARIPIVSLTFNSERREAERK